MKLEFKKDYIYEFKMKKEDDDGICAHYVSLCIDKKKPKTEVKAESFGTFNDLIVYFDEEEGNTCVQGWECFEYIYNTSTIILLGHKEDHPEYFL